MLRTLKDPARLARTFALAVPGWLARSFNELAPHRGYRAIAPPDQIDMKAFEEPGAVARAASA
jgi:hypothetical protein